VLLGVCVGGGSPDDEGVTVALGLFGGVFVGVDVLVGVTVFVGVNVGV
jgi:hypothetical protein